MEGLGHAINKDEDAVDDVINFSMQGKVKPSKGAGLQKMRSAFTSMQQLMRFASSSTSARKA